MGRPGSVCSTSTFILGHVISLFLQKEISMSRRKWEGGMGMEGATSVQFGSSIILASGILIRVCKQAGCQTMIGFSPMVGLPVFDS